MLSTSVLLPPSPNWYGSQLAALQPSINQVAYAGHSSVVVACCNTNSVLRTLCAGPSRVTALCWSASPATPQQLVAGHEDGGLRTWDARSGACMRSHKKKGAEVSALVLLDRQPALAVVGDAKGGLQLWQYQAGSKPQALQVALRGKVTQLCSLSEAPATSANHATGLDQPADATASGMTSLAGGAPLVLAACSDGSVTLLDIEAGLALHCFSAHRGCVHALSVVWAAPSVLPATCIVSTASGEEGTAKVWQLSCATRQHAVGLLATLAVPGTRNEAGGGRGYQSRQRTQPQWLAATLLPALPAAGSGAGASLQGQAVGDGAAAYCWVALGLATGEVWLNRVHAVSGRVDAPYKLFGLHNRPVFGVMAMLVPSTPMAVDARVLASMPVPPSLQPSTADDQSVASGQAEHQSGDGQVQPADPAVGEATDHTPAGQQDKAVAPVRRHKIMMVTISQDRTMAVTHLHLKLGPASRPVKAAGKAGKGAAGKGKAASALAEGTQADTGSSSTPDAATGKASEQQTARSATPVDARAPSPGGRAGAQAESEPAAQENSAQTTPPRSKQMPVFRVALGPPADRTQRGFGGRGSARSTPADSTTTTTMSQAQSDGEGVVPENGDHVPAPPAAPPPPTMPTPVTPLACLQPAADAAGGSSLAGPDGESAALAWYVSGHEPAWQLPGLGGYAHSVDVPLPRTRSEVLPGSTNTMAGAEHGPVEVNSFWEMVTGCGDRTIRTSHFQWPVTCDVVSRKVAGSAGQATVENATANAEEAIQTNSEGGSADKSEIGGESIRQSDGSPGVESVEAGGGLAQTAEAGPGDGVGDVSSGRWRTTVGRAMVLGGSMLWRNLADQVLCVARHPASAREQMQGRALGKWDTLLLETELGYIAFGCQDGQVGVFDTQKEVPHLYSTRHQGPVLQLCWYAATLPASTAHPALTPSASTGPLLSATGDREPPTHTMLQQQQQAGAGPAAAQLASLTEAADVPPPPPPADGEVIVAAQEFAAGQERPDAQGKGQHSAAQRAAAAQQQQSKQQAHLAMHAACQSWQLVSCGAEGRLLTWQLPELHEWGAAGPQGGGGGPASRGSADRSGRWGAAAATPATSVANDLLPHLLPLLPLAAGQPATPAQPTLAQPAGTAAQHSVCTLAVVPRVGGDLLVLALNSGLLAVLASAQQQQGQRQLQPHQRKAAAGSHGSGDLQWNLLWSRQVEGAPPSMLAARLAPDNPSSLSIACASSRCCPAVYTAHLPCQLPSQITAPQPTHVPSSTPPGVSDATNTHADEMASEPHLPQPLVLQDQDSTAVRTITSLCWLPDVDALALGCAEDATIQIWAAAGPVRDTNERAWAEDEATGTTAAVMEAEKLQPHPLVPPGQPVMLTALRGHTDHVMSMVARSAGGHAAADGLVWLFSGSRDQSARGWVLDPVALWHQHRQHRQAQLLRQQQLQLQQALEQEAATKEQELLAAEAAEAATGGGDSTEPLATDSSQGVPSAGLAGTTLSQTLAADSIPLSTGDGSLQDVASSHAQPSILVAAPAKNDITGVPGGRPKGSKKPLVLGAKQILDPEAVAGGQAAVVQSAEHSWRQLQALLSGLSAEAATHQPTTAEPQQDVAGAVQAAVGALADPVALVASGQAPRAPEKLIMVHLWAGDVKAALQVAVEHQLLSADLVSVSACMGRAAWAATARLYAAQQEAAGQVHVAAMHLMAVGDRPAAAAAYRRAGLLLEARAVDSAASLVLSAATSPS